MIGLLLLLACAPTERPLRVAAASSLTECFGQLEAHFEAEHPDVDVQLVFAGSQTLSTQIRHGLAVDVYASANGLLVDGLVADGLASEPAPFAANRLVLVGPPGRPMPTLADLPEAGSLVIGSPTVPVGHYTDLLLDAADDLLGADWRQAVDARVVSREPNVRQVLAKVALGEADLAVVYATDARIADVVTGSLPTTLAPRPVYRDALVQDGELGRAWRDFVRSATGRQVLLEHGFDLP